MAGRKKVDKDYDKTEGLMPEPSGFEADPGDSDSEYIKKKYFYRTLIVKGKARVKNRSTTRRLVGPDCAYHLYSYMEKEDDNSADGNNS